MIQSLMEMLFLFYKLFITCLLLFIDLCINYSYIFDLRNFATVWNASHVVVVVRATKYGDALYLDV